MDRMLTVERSHGEQFSNPATDADTVPLPTVQAQEVVAQSRTTDEDVAARPDALDEPGRLECVQVIAGGAWNSPRIRGQLTGRAGLIQPTQHPGPAASEK
jgi:hypothetical protein